MTASVILEKRFAVGYEETKEYDLTLLRNAKLKIKIESSEPINVYFLDKWHFEGENPLHSLGDGR